MEERELRTLICRLFLGGDDAPIEPDMDLLESGICDSLGLVRLVAELERSVSGLKVLDQEITRQNLGSIRAMGEFIRRKQGL